MFYHTLLPRGLKISLQIYNGQRVFKGTSRGLKKLTFMTETKTSGQAGNLRIENIRKKIIVALHQVTCTYIILITMHR
jgi:hypothetical protein